MVDERPGLLVRTVGTGGRWEAPEMTTYTDEDHLQSIIAAEPQHVPGVPEGALAIRELGTSAGPADVCIVAPDGSLTVVECKLASNSERRRMVIGQVLDYASAIRDAGPQAFRAQWARQRGPDLGILDESALEALGTNITDGRIDLCLAVDRIDADLRRLIEFLNEITRDEIGVTALQLGYARHGAVEILVPSTYGGEIAAAKARASGRPEEWTEESFLAAIGSEDDRVRAGTLLSRTTALTERRGDSDLLWFGRRPRGAIFLHVFGVRFAPIQLWINKTGQLMVQGNWNGYAPVRQHPGFADLAALLGQDHRSGATGTVLADIDLDELWQTALRCAEAVNAQPIPTTDTESPS